MRRAVRKWGSAEEFAEHAGGGEPGVFCLTGKTAAGKNHVCDILGRHGFVSVDLDEAAHRAIDRHRKEIVSAFSDEATAAGIRLANPDGSIDRKALGNLLFRRPNLLARHEGIVYPDVIRETKEFIGRNHGRSILINAAVLYKTPELLKACSKILVVEAPLLTRLRRMRERDGLTVWQMLPRILAQRTSAAEYGRAGIPTEVISNG